MGDNLLKKSLPKDETFPLRFDGQEGGQVRGRLDDDETEAGRDLNFVGLSVSWLRSWHILNAIRSH